ncbi:MAG: threonine aldolase [Betaproteobacteria bacterium]|nr:threonine aldolase [Betaproteobacteria bacterium]
MTPADLATLRQSCRLSVAGHALPTPAETFAAMAQWSEKNGVGHDAYGEGEFIQAFEKKVANLLGMEAAVFCITGTLSQAVALRLACEARGNKLVALHPSAHILKHERSNYQLLDHFQVLQVGDPFRPWTHADLHAIADPLAAALYELPMREIGGQLPAWDELEAIKAHCLEHDIHLHMDGARLWETAGGAWGSAGHGLREIAAGFASVYVSFYKGIGGLGGAMLLGEKDFIEQAKVWMQRLGGNVYRRLPYVVSAAMQFDARLAAMPACYQRTLWLYELLKSYPQFAPNPAAPQCNMLHLYLPVSAEHANEIRNTIAKDHGIWLFGRASNGPLPEQSYFEWYVGDQMVAMRDADVKNALDLLTKGVAQ